MEFKADGFQQDAGFPRTIHVAPSSEGVENEAWLSWPREACSEIGFVVSRNTDSKKLSDTDSGRAERVDLHTNVLGRQSGRYVALIRHD